MLNKLFNYINKKRKLVESFRSSAKYLSSGKYCFDDNLTFMYLKDDELKKHYKSLFEKKTFNNSLYSLIIKILRITIFSKEYKVYNKKKLVNCEDFAGTVYLPANNNDVNKDIRIFDFSNKKVLTIYAEAENFKKKLSTYDNFKKFFLMPKILWFDNDNMLIIEELIDYMPKIDWKKEDSSYVVNVIINNYLDYFKAVQSKEKFIIKTSESMIENLSTDINFLDFYKRNKFYLNGLSGTSLPYLSLHGDMWFYNILYTKEKNCYFIDWEHSNQYMLFYDFFWFMQYEATYNQDFTYIDNYFTGVYDNFLKEGLEIFNLSFNKQDKLDYFIAFVLNVFSTRIIKSDENTKKSTYNQFSNLLEMIKEKYKNI